MLLFYIILILSTCIHSYSSQLLLTGGILGHLQKLIQIYSISIDVMFVVQLLHNVCDLCHRLINSIDLVLNSVDNLVLRKELVLINIISFKHILELRHKFLIGFKANNRHTQQDESK